jgi:hypothetical protein
LGQLFLGFPLTLGRFMVLPNQPFQLLPFRVIQVFSFSSSSGTMNVAHGSSLNNDFVLHPYIVSESRELFFHLILQVAPSFKDAELVSKLLDRYLLIPEAHCRRKPPNSFKPCFSHPWAEN